MSPGARVRRGVWHRARTTQAFGRRIVPSNRKHSGAIVDSRAQLRRSRAPVRPDRRAIGKRWKRETDRHRRRNDTNFPRKKPLRGIPFAPNCAIVAADGAVLPVTGRSASECSALCRASTHRKENYGYCQESYKEAGRKETRCEKIRCEKTRREKTRREKTRSEETGRKEGRKETRSKAQTERRVHESDDAIGRCSLRSSARRRCRAPK